MIHTCVYVLPNGTVGEHTFKSSAHTVRGLVRAACKSVSVDSFFTDVAFFVTSDEVSIREIDGIPVGILEFTSLVY